VIEEWLTGLREGKVEVKVPQRGVKSRLMETVQRNAKLAFEARFRSPHAMGAQVLDDLQEILGLPEVPYRIEAFDISHIQGAETVASMVVWEGGRARKSDYRRFRIRTVEGVDDFASMGEVIARRYSRVLKEGKNLPDLALIDGGKGQLEAARSALARIEITSLPLAAIAKREELLFVPGRTDPIRIDPASPILHLVQRIRDEAHRFAITYHRSLRAKRTIASELTEVAGVGEKTAKRLLRKFGSISGIRSASPEDLESEVGAKLAGAIQRHLAETSRR
jgi:excinuclease ABC subunit C